MGERPTPVAPATDDLPGLGRLVQLFLRGDGLTTTSLQVLTGDRITVDVLRHEVQASAVGRSDGSAYTGVAAHAPDAQVGDAFDELDLDGTEPLLRREVLLRGRQVWGASTVVAVLDRVPSSVARSLATTDEPIGRALHAAGMPTSRELRAWGLVPADRWTGRLSAVTSPSTRIPRRAYVMRSVADARPVAHFVEWFSPAIFDR